MAARKTPSAGSKPDKLWRDALMVAIKRSGGDDPRPYIARIAERCVEMAANGDMQAIKEVGDRIDGKAAQQLTLDGFGEGGAIPLIVTGVRRDGD